MSPRFPERALAFGRASTLLGVLTEAAAEARPPEGKAIAAVLLNAGLLPRVGPNRIHVALARRLASVGVPALRFDLDGLGDSPASSEGGDFEERAVRETRLAMDVLAREASASRFVLFGMCSGADIALLTAREEPRVAGLVLVNGRLFDVEAHRDVYRRAEASTRKRYYRSRMFDPRSWLRLLLGKSNVRALAATARGIVRARLAPRPLEHGEGRGAEDAPLVDLASLEARQARLLLLVSEGSVAWDLLPRVLGPSRPALARGTTRVERLRGADHVFTLRFSQEWLIETTASWVGSLLAEREPAPVPVESGDGS